MVKANLALSQEGPGAIREIEAQLERILMSPDFDVPERAHRFLKYVVTESLSGRAHRIKAYTIAVEVFGRDQSFDPQLDPVVRIEAGQVRRGLERFYLKAGSSDLVVITIPKGSYAPVFSRRSDEKPSDSAEPVSPRKTPKVLRAPFLALAALAAVVLLLTTWAALQWFVFPRNTAISASDLA